MGNIVSNTVMTMYGASWLLEISGETLRKVYDCVPNMLISPETNTKWYWMKAVIEKNLIKIKIKNKNN